MSLQFGRWNFDGCPVDTRYLDQVSNLLSRYGPDSRGSHVGGNVSLLYFPFHVTPQSGRETQPHVTRRGDVIAWDGVLDERDQLTNELGLVASEERTDCSLVEAAWERWGTNAFARLMGDWALTIWSPARQTLFFAKDFLGTRHLYYYANRNHIAWSTVLDPLVMLAERSFHLDEEYVAGWLSHFPATESTPFEGVRAVAPASYLRVQNRKIKTTKYWDFRASHTVSYRKDRDYEEHFLGLLEKSVWRRLRSHAPILAELSGGMDSSSIVCVADKLVNHGCAPGTRIDTVSYYQEGEPAWDERPYIAAIEKVRGRTGCHIDVSSHTLLSYQYDSTLPELTPVSRGVSSESMRQLARCIAANQNRVVLSGFGGDEVLGGAPSFLPQLADLFVGARFVSLSRQLKAWALSNRTTILDLVVEVACTFLPPRWSGTSTDNSAAPWLDAHFVAKHHRAFSRYQSPFSLFRIRPSLQEKLETIEALRREIASGVQTAPLLYEKRYPYLDRDLVEFLFAIPPDQLQRPGQRRSLMRRALAGIVPDEVLNRKRKAFLARQPLLDVRAHWSAYRELAENSILVDRRVIDRRRLLGSLEQANAGSMIPVALLAHAIVLEKWLQHVQPHGILDVAAALSTKQIERPPFSSIQSQLRQLQRKGGDTDEIQQA
jgi:asparagine synthase (glutamine-hydrolysing)